MVSLHARGLLPLVLSAALPAQVVGSSFASGTDGWTVVNASYNGHIVLPSGSPTLPQWDLVEGQAAPSLRVGDVFGETGIRAPAAFLGDQLHCFGGTLSWDILIRTTDAVAYPAVWLVGATKTLVYNTPSPPLGVWHSASVPLVEAGWRVNGWQGAAATRGDLMEVLADLRGLLLNTEWRTGPDDTSVDNVALAPPVHGVRCYGAGCFGSNGRWPTVYVTGTVQSGATVGIEFTDGVPGALTAVVVGFGPANVPIFGCTAWITPTPTNFVLLLDGVGAASMTATVPPSPLGPLAVLQAVSFDAAAPNGYGLALSNAVALTVQ